MHANDGAGELSPESKRGGTAGGTSNGTPLSGLHAAVIPQEQESTSHGHGLEDLGLRPTQGSGNPGALTTANLGVHKNSPEFPVKFISGQLSSQDRSTCTIFSRMLMTLT